VVRTTVFDASDRRRYEQELLRSRDREQEIARQLQRSLLGGALPEDPTLDLSVAYLPAVDGLEVGGDWYDAFRIGERTVALVVGDVVGRGIEAAAAMGQLRSAVRALAATSLEPGPLLEALDRYAHAHGVGQMTTIAYATLDLDTGALVHACAGHPPPAVLAPEAPPAFAMGGRSAPLDAYLVPTSRPQAQLLLPDEAVVLLFTDGLFERAGRPLQAGLDELLMELGRHRGAPTAELTRALPRAMLASREIRDDVCVVAVRRRRG
jgi:serine phosphatase RsbU (regulator of sigma subunit)